MTTCAETCWETWTESEDGRLITYVVQGCGHAKAQALEAAMTQVLEGARAESPVDPSFWRRELGLGEGAP